MKLIITIQHLEISNGWLTFMPMSYLELCRAKQLSFQVLYLLAWVLQVQLVLGCQPFKLLNAQAICFTYPFWINSPMQSFFQTGHLLAKKVNMEILALQLFFKSFHLQKQFEYAKKMLLYPYQFVIFLCPEFCISSCYS